MDAEIWRTCWFRGGLQRGCRKLSEGEFEKLIIPQIHHVMLRLSCFGIFSALPGGHMGSNLSGKGGRVGRKSTVVATGSVRAGLVDVLQMGVQWEGKSSVCTVGEIQRLG